MSKSEILYVKGMNLSETEEEEELHEDIWDDKKLNDAYDKALRIANIEVAKRVAMSTNTHHVNKDEHSKSKKEKPSKSSSSKKKHDWKVGGFCRAVYEGDGLEYEAFVVRIIDATECVVRFLGYDNSEIVSINSLKPSLGNEERTIQIEQALREKVNEEYPSHYPDSEAMECSDRVLSAGNADHIPKRKLSKKKKHSKGLNGFGIPEMPFPMPSASLMRNFGSMEMPCPPPPPMNFSNITESEDQAVSSMLLSWYMSGYYTGLYQGMKRARENSRHQ